MYTVINKLNMIKDSLLTYAFFSVKLFFIPSTFQFMMHMVLVSSLFSGISNMEVLLSYFIIDFPTLVNKGYYFTRYPPLRLRCFSLVSRHSFGIFWCLFFLTAYDLKLMPHRLFASFIYLPIFTSFLIHLKPILFIDQNYSNPSHIPGTPCQNSLTSLAIAYWLV